MAIRYIYEIVESEKEHGKKEAVSKTTAEFAIRREAEKYLHERYLDTRLFVDCGNGEKVADYCNTGWYVEDCKGNLFEGRLVKKELKKVIDFRFHI